MPGPVENHVQRRPLAQFYFLAARQHCFVGRDVSGPAGRINQPVGFQLFKEGGDIVQALFGCAPENRMLARISNLERFLRREPDQPVVSC